MDLVFLSFQEQGDGRHRQQTLMQSQLVKCQKRSGSLSSPFIMHPKNVIISASLSIIQHGWHCKCYNTEDVTTLISVTLETDLAAMMQHYTRHVIKDV